MAEKIEVTGKSDAEIAYALFKDIARVEKKDLNPGISEHGPHIPDREYIIKAFSQCMYAVKRPDVTK